MKSTHVNDAKGGHGITSISYLHCLDLFFELIMSFVGVQGPEDKKCQIKTVEVVTLDGNMCTSIQSWWQSSLTRKQPYENTSTKQGPL